MKHNPKAFWSYVNSKLKSRSGVADSYNEEGENSTSNKEKAEILSSFFSKVFTKEDLENSPTLEDRKVDRPLMNIDINQEDLPTKLQNLKPHKSPGPDGLQPRVLREISVPIAIPFRIIYKRMIQSSQLPEDFKIGEVIPIFKKGNRHYAANYRLVSLTSVASKVLESIFRDNIMSHMKRNNLFSKDQHSFLEGRSTITHLLEVLEEWTKTLDEGGTIDTISMDFMKAFDTVPHQRLLRKLLAYQIQGPVHSWIQAFLLNRKQRVVVGGEKSSWTNVTSGIPQGSVLGPVLFAIFINDLPSCIQSGIKLFADDTKLFRPVASIEDCDNLQKDLTEAEMWAKKWQMKFHPEKCSVLRIGKNHPDYNYTMQEGQVNLNTVQQEKDLGVIIDNQLLFSEQVQKAVAKANSMLGIIRRSFEYLDEETMMFLYKAKVRPVVEYGNNVWSPRLVRDIEAVEAVQHRATKLIPGLQHLEYEERLRKLGLPTLVYRRHRGDMIQVFKYMTGKYNVETDMFPPPTVNHTRGHKYKTQKQRCRLQVRQKFFSQRVVEKWNNLPESVVLAPSLNSFKARLDKHWRDEPFHYECRGN